MDVGRKAEESVEHPRFIDWGRRCRREEIDEFDAFLHYESAAAIIRTLNRSRTFQTILTTHNASLMNNDPTRMECCYVMYYEGGAAGPGAPIRIKSLAEATPQKIRKSTTGKRCAGTECSMADRPKTKGEVNSCARPTACRSCEHLIPAGQLFRKQGRRVRLDRRIDGTALSRTEASGSRRHEPVLPDNPASRAISFANRSSFQ